MHEEKVTTKKVPLYVWDNFGLPITLVASINYHDEEPINWAVYAGLDRSNEWIAEWGNKLAERVAAQNFPEYKNIPYRD